MSECDYYILQEEGDIRDVWSVLVALQDSVQEYMRDNSDWRPVGGVSMVASPLDDKVIAAQAMLRCWT
jgi:hypothetical protein